MKGRAAHAPEYHRRRVSLISWGGQAVATKNQFQGKGLILYHVYWMVSGIKSINTSITVLPYMLCPSYLYIL